MIEIQLINEIHGMSSSPIVAKRIKPKVTKEDYILLFLDYIQDFPFDIQHCTIYKSKKKNNFCGVSMEYMVEGDIQRKSFKFNQIFASWGIQSL